SDGHRRIRGRVVALTEHRGLVTGIVHGYARTLFTPAAHCQRRRGTERRLKEVSYDTPARRTDPRGTARHRPYGARTAVRRCGRGWPRRVEPRWTRRGRRFRRGDCQRT